MKPDNQASIRAAFRERRKRLGVTQSEMEEHLGCNRRTYGRLETSTRLSPEIRAQLDKLLTELEDEMGRQMDWQIAEHERLEADRKR